MPYPTNTKSLDLIICSPLFRFDQNTTSEFHNQIFYPDL